ncbi:MULTISPECIES: NifU family protein [Psychrilyobacter]|nr:MULTISPECIES: NifU family protein [Psychrilyobacter]MCS5422148.1 NifU family protein [Psychrilyobacter sp. S5]NDI78448.1 NifU family protein [Psychrilyobacter piezotolerans]
MLQKVEKIISEKIRPSIKEHGGDISVVSVQDEILKIKLLGNCIGCHHARFTTEELVKKIILLEDIGIKDVVLETGVSEDLIEMAKKLLAKKAT